MDVCYEIYPGEDLHDGVSYEMFLARVGNQFNPTGKQGVYGGFQSWIDRAGRCRRDTREVATATLMPDKLQSRVRFSTGALPTGQPPCIQRRKKKKRMAGGSLQRICHAMSAAGASNLRPTDAKAGPATRPWARTPGF